MRVSTVLTSLVVLAAIGGGAWFYRVEIATTFPVVASVAVKQLGLDPALFAPPPADKPADGQRRGGGPTAVLTALAQTVDMPVAKRAIGFVEASAVVTVRSRIDSQILEQHVKDGQFVNKGDVLFVLDDRELQAQLAKDQAVLARDEAVLARTRLDLTRGLALLGKSAGTQQMVDQAKADAASAAATVEADHATLETDKLRLSYARIEAPLDGRIGVVQVAPGNLVTASGTTPLVTITQMKPIRVAFTLPEHELAGLKALVDANQPAIVRVTPSGGGRPAATGALSFLDSAVDMASGTIALKATFANDDLALWPGQYVDVELDAGALKGAVTVPTIAVQQGQKGPFVYVVKDDATVEVRQVAVAQVAGDQSAIADGLKPGEKVVTEGQLRLRNGASVREASAEAPDAAGSPKKDGGRKPKTATLDGAPS